VLVFLEKDGLEWLLAAIAAFLFVVVSHPTTVLFVLGTIGAREIIIRMNRLRARIPSSRLVRPWPISVFLLIWLSWLFTGAITIFGIQANQIYDQLRYLFYIPEAVGGTVQLRAAENIFVISPQIRLLVLGSFVLLALLSLALYLFTRRRKERATPASALALFVFPFVIVPLDLVLLSGQIYDRGILYLVLGASIIITLVMISWSRGILRNIVAVGVVVLALLCMTTTFYQETLYVTSEESLKATEFIHFEMPKDTMVGGGMIPSYVWGEQPPSDFAMIRLMSVYPQYLTNLTGGVVPGALVFDRTSELWHAQYGYKFVYDFYLNDALKYSKVYDSGAYWIAYAGATAL
jgi:hypothetical protein